MLIMSKAIDFAIAFGIRVFYNQAFKFPLEDANLFA